MAFKNLVCGMRWKLHFINYDFTFMGTYRRNNYMVNRMMCSTKLKRTYIHKIEDGQIILVTIFLEHKSAGEFLVKVSRRLENPVYALLRKINFKVENVFNKLKKINCDGNSYVCPEPNALLLFNGEPVDTNELCSEIFNLRGDLRLRLFGDYNVCLMNEPFVSSVQIPQTPVSKTFIYPSEIHTLFADRVDVRWLKSLEINSGGAETWTEVGKKLYYMIQEDDINHYLKCKCVPKNKDLVGPPYELIIKTKVQPNQCSYYYPTTHKLTKEEVQEGMFRLVSYNVLANYYTHTKEAKKMFYYCPSFALEKNQRFSAIIDELTGYKPDLICLQEIDKNVFESLFSPFFKEQGFCGFLCPKLNSPEGTGCFYRNKKFTVLSSENFNYGAEILENPYLTDILLYTQKKYELFKKITSLKHCLQLMALQSEVNRNEILIVGNVHLYSNPEATLIKTLQVAAIFGLLKSLLNQLKPLIINKNVSFILCGDFNSTPSSPVHNYIKSSMSDKTFQDHEIMEPYDSNVFSHSLKMKSACEELLFTNYTEDFQGCLDYIYYEKDKLEVDKVYPTADEDKLSAHIGIPSVSFPSDHLPLIVDFKWKH